MIDAAAAATAYRTCNLDVRRVYALERSSMCQSMLRPPGVHVPYILISMRSLCGAYGD